MNKKIIVIFICSLMLLTVIIGSAGISINVVKKSFGIFRPLITPKIIMTILGGISIAMRAEHATRPVIYDLE